MSFVSSSLVTYTLNNVNVNDANHLKRFLLTYLPYGKKFYDLQYNDTAKTLQVITREGTFLDDTNTQLQNLVFTKYPNPAKEDLPVTADAQVVQSASAYGYFYGATAIDGNVVVSTNLSLTRNMYYKNLTVNAGVTLNTNGWRIVVSEQLTLNGTISHDGSDAVSTTPGTGTATIYTTYLGSGSDGGAGLTANGAGKSGVAADYQCSGGRGGSGGNAFSVYVGGAGGTYQAISTVDGGINMLSTMPVAFMGRLMAQNSYIMGGTGGGGGGAMKVSSTTVKSGAGGGGGGLIVLAARIIDGTGKISAKGGNGSAASYTGTNLPNAGGGGGGGGGCVIIVSQQAMSSSITIDVSGGLGGAGVGAGFAGLNGTAGNIFTLQI